MACATSPTSLPSVPAKHSGFTSYVASHPQASIWDLVEPYKRYDAKLREVFAREPCHPALSDHWLNVVPVFGSHESDLKIRARKLHLETEQEKEKYVMPLKDADRKPDGSPAIVQSLKEFQTNFNLFSESSLVDLDWSNVVAAGSSVVTALLPVPGKYSGSKRALRQYYHEIVAPASDVDLFIYGLTEEEAIEKIKQIETKIRDSILQETTTIRTKNAITIASQYPTRHVQIVLRIYKSVSEILTGFDVDCSCAAYDGKQVYASPRALASYMTQINTVDLTRRSPSYENRLSKYSRRGFEVYWAGLDRSRIDPTIFERSFARTVGLARLLVLEKLPTSSEREKYLEQRRKERGRPAINRNHHYARRLRGNIKDRYEDEVAEWVDQEEVSDYHTFTIPYGEKFYAKKIEKLLYTKDLLLNAEWNQPKDREVNLHRHPAFFGSVEDIIRDCCGFCPQPITPEEEEIAEEECKIFVSGDISFIKDDPGRQAIGSFNPITDDDWTEMAYVGNTARLCQAIVDGDLEHVQDWLAQEGSDPNRRDYTGRTPLHLAVLSSTPEIVQCLVDHGARLVWRLADGRTALHLAASRGNVQMVKILMEKSEENEEEEAKKVDLRKQARAEARRETKNNTDAKSDESAFKEDDDGEMIADEVSDDEDFHSRTTGSFVKVRHAKEKLEGDALPDDDIKDEPDVYDINALAWDAPCSPLHLAILNGHTGVVRELVQNFGADVLLPIKLLSEYDRRPRGAILTLVLALTLPLDKADEMARTLLELGASPAQADINHMTALHYFATQGSPKLVDALLEHNLPAVKGAINHLSMSSSYWSPRVSSPLTIAIESGDAIGALKILDAGANPTIDFSKFMESLQSRHESRINSDPEKNKQLFLKNVEQPVMLALQHEEPSIVLGLLSRGAEPNTLTATSQSCISDEWQSRNSKGESLLDVVRQKLTALRKYIGENGCPDPPEPLNEDEYYLKDLKSGTYKYWVADSAVKAAKHSYELSLKHYQEAAEKANNREGLVEKKEAVQDLLHQLEEVEEDLLRRGAKTFDELYPKPEVSDIYHDRPYQGLKPVPFEVKFSFKIPDLTDVRKDAYLDLYEASWAGDLQKIKSLTLALWGPESHHMPLKIAVQDSNGFSPFAIAILRGHLDLAKAILEIAQAQYQPKEQSGRQRYSMRPNENAYSEYDSAEDEDDDRLHIFSEIIDDQFTVDNIGEVCTHVKSDVEPLSLLNWSYRISEFVNNESGGRAKSEPTTAGCLVQYAIWADNIDLLVFLLQLGAEYTGRSPEDETTSGTFQLAQGDLDYAIRLGRTRALAELIKRTGVGIPLDDLVKRSGVEVKEKPKFYQGLSVHGKKRKDWAAAVRGSQMHRTDNKHPPLLIAAFEGSIESVEWFLSDAPLRHYSEFAVANQDDKRLKNLFKSAGGFNAAFSSWLSARTDLIIHCLVLSKPSDDSLRLLQYLVKAVPTSLDVKSSTGHTPLHLAFSLRRLSMARALIDIGADQATRDHKGNNLVHSLLCPINGGGHTIPKDIGEMLSLIDERLRTSLVTERTSAGPGAATPLALWLDTVVSGRFGSKYHDNDCDDKCTTLSILLSFSPQAEELELINGAGDTPLHAAIRSDLPRLLEIMLNKRPELLYRENATGRTPVEMAQDSLVSQHVTGPPPLPCDSYGYHRCSFTDLVKRAPESFTEKSKEEEKEKRTTKERTWKVCEAFMKAFPGKRRLVSLFDANEVAKRLASRQPEYERRARKVEDEDGESEDVEEKLRDEVETWYDAAARFEWREPEKGSLDLPL